jgi:N-acetylmuramic acid 6-phosphate etherase
MTMINHTEQPSHHADLETLSTAELLRRINSEDVTVPTVVARAIPQIEALIDRVVDRMQRGGRVFYIGAGTSGRLGVVDASEIPPTYGVPDAFVGLIAGGDSAIRKAVEGAEDNKELAWEDLSRYDIGSDDTVIGIAASGTTPYVLGGLEAARGRGLLTGAVVCNVGSPVAAAAEFPVEVVVGPEFVTGSTRMKAGTAQKLVLNMISTTAMIRLGRVEGNRMVNMQLTNKKLVGRGTRMIMEATGLDAEEAEELLLRFGSVKRALEHYLPHQDKSGKTKF